MIDELLPDDPPWVGPYRLIRRLGAGGMGRVYLARSAGGHRVAVKVIRPDLASDRMFRIRFAREVAAARTVSGMYTALVVNADTGGPVPWLATAYVAGPSLAEAVDEQGPLPTDSLRALAAGLAEGLQAIHLAGLVHRDLKPSNVLLGHDGPRVIDFGISRALDASRHTATGVLLGTPGFMSPEQAQSRSGEVGPASDVFGLGGVLVFAATGSGPFGEGPGHALVYRAINEEPDLSGVPAELRPLIARCLAKDPARRPTPAELLAELDEGVITDGWLPPEVSGVIHDYEAAPDAGAEAVPEAGPEAAPDAGSEAGPGAGPEAAPGPRLPSAADAGPTLLVQAPEPDEATRASALPVARPALAPPPPGGGDPGQDEPAVIDDGVIDDGAVGDRASRPPAARRRPGRRRLAVGLASAAVVVTAVAVSVALLVPGTPAARRPTHGALAEPTPTVVTLSPSSRPTTHPPKASSSPKPTPRRSLRTSPAATVTTVTTAATPDVSQSTHAAESLATSRSSPTAISPSSQAATRATTPPPAAPPVTAEGTGDVTEYSCGDAPASTTTSSASFEVSNDSSVTVEVNGTSVQGGGSWTAPDAAVGAVWEIADAGGCLGVFKQDGAGGVIVT
jgi:eukaryotic-like serine/threonine-protein kinase